MAYATVAELRALDGLDNATVYPDATLQDGIDFATALIDGYCGTSFEARTFSVTRDGNGRPSLATEVLFIQTITSVTVDGVAQTAADFVGRPDGIVYWKAGTFTWQPYGQNVVIAGTAGKTLSAEDLKRIKRAARDVARDYCLSLHSRIPSRALGVTNELGQFELRAQAGGPGRPTALPDVNATLNSPRFKHKPGMGALFS